jgi:predicted TIM-barrel fold metal-dependent hydrolase
VLFDGHLHIVDPRFPLVASRGYRPEPFTVEDYRDRTAGLGVSGGAVVSASFQGFDQAYLVDALERLGPAFVGVTQLPAAATDEEILALDRAGVRGVRFTLHRGGELDDRLARRVHELAGWHAEVYVDGRELAALESRLRALPRVSIDHLGMHRDGLPALLRLVEHGAKVKASGFGRVELDVAATLWAIAAVDPTALLFGTDLPGTRARRSFEPADRDLVAAVAPLALADNALAWYRPRAWSSAPTVSRRRSTRR